MEANVLWTIGPPISPNPMAVVAETHLGTMRSVQTRRGVEADRGGTDRLEGDSYKNQGR